MKTKILPIIVGLILLPIALIVALVFVSEWESSRFSKVNGGATMSEVLSIAGVPDSATTNEAGGYVQWRYKDPWPWRSLTSVFFGTNGVYRVYHP